MAFIKQAEKDGTLYELNPRSVAEQFSASTAYAAGDHVYYDGTLYCFTTAHAAGAWNANHVTAVTVGAELTDLKADLNPIVEKDILVSKASDATFTTIYLNDGTTTTNSSFRTTDYIDVSEYERLEYKLRGGASSSQRMSLLTFFDSEKVFVYSVSAVVNNGTIESDIPVPSNAKYVIVLCQIASTIVVPYVYGIKRNTIQSDINDMAYDVLSKIEDVPFNLQFDDPICYNNDGTITSGGSTSSPPYRRMSRRIACNAFTKIKYGLIGLSGQRMLVFYDEDLSPVGYKAGSGSNSYLEGEMLVPSTAKYVSGAWLSSKTDTPYIIGCNENADVKADNLYALGNVSPAYENAVVSEDMTLSEFITACNDARSAWSDLNLCTMGCFRWLTGVNSFEDAYDRLNKGFRQDVYVEGISKHLLYDRINAAFETRIRMFEDAKLNLDTPCDFSVRVTETYSGEPSTVVSSNGGELWVYSYGKRLKSDDGFTWSEPTAMVRSDSARTPVHQGLSVVDDTIFMFGRDPDNEHNLKMYTSPLSDGINFTYRGVPLPIGYDFGDGLNIDNWGNSFLIKEGDTYYLFVEGRQNVDGNFWDIYLVTCTDPFVDNGDGTIGNWQNCGVAPVIQARSLFDTSDSIAFGNPCIACGSDNRPIKVDGKFFMYFHSTASNYSYICRAYSYDLINWIPENRVFDNREKPTEGENQSSNADHSLIEFKGRTFFF